MTKNRYITILLILSVLLNTFVLQACSKKSDAGKEQTVETNEVTDTVDTSEQETAKDTETEEEKETEPQYDPKPKYTETPYPSGLTVEEKIEGYEVFEIPHDPINNLEIFNFVSENQSILPSEFAATFTHIPDFAIIVKEEYNDFGSRSLYIKELYYKNTEVIVDINIVFDRNSHLVFDGNTVCIGDTYYTGHYYLLAPNTYMKLGGDRNKKYDNPLDADTTYKIEYKDGRLEYHACHVSSPVYITFIDYCLFGYLNKPEDLQHDYSSWGEIKYSNGTWTVIEEGRYTIAQRYADELDYRYECEKRDSEDLRQYETYMDYLEAKEQGLLDKVHYYWDRD